MNYVQSQEKSCHLNILFKKTLLPIEKLYMDQKNFRIWEIKHGSEQDKKKLNTEHEG